MKKACFTFILILAVCLMITGCAPEVPHIRVTDLPVSPENTVMSEDTSASGSSLSPAAGMSESLMPYDTLPEDDMDEPDGPAPSPPPLSDAAILCTITKDIDGDGKNEYIYIAAGEDEESEDIKDIFIYVRDGSETEATSHPLQKRRRVTTAFS